MKTLKKQKRKFIEAAREAECSEDEAIFDRAIQQIAKAKPAKKKARSVESGSSK